MSNQSSFNQIGLFIRKDDPVMEFAIEMVHEFLKQRSLSVVSNEPLPFLSSLGVVADNEFANCCDLTIAIGGDGTMLSAACALAGSNIPIVGINVGRLGFLADVTISNLANELDPILQGYYREDWRYLLQATIHNSNLMPTIAMNDVVIHAHQNLHMIEFETYINGRFLNSQRADGLVISTPTGSTAYAMSAGGPILDVDIDVNLLASVCPHSLSNRPLVIAANKVIEIVLSEKNMSTAMLTCDGRPGYTLQPGDSVKIERHMNAIRLLHPQDHDHYSILRAKLDWGKKLT